MRTRNGKGLLPDSVPDLLSGLIPQVVSPASARLYVAVHYTALDSRNADFTLEADDPPPRT